MAAAIPPFPLPALRVADLHGFLALRETEPCPALHALADRAVAELDRLRAPAEAAELARRRAAGLSPAQDALLQRWGYPYVFGEWFFHMTLTRRLADTERDAWHARTRDFFAAPLLRARLVSDICLFTQSAPGRAFHLAKRIPLRG